MSLKDRIKELANEKGISLPALEAELGFGNSTIVKWDKSTPNADKLRAVAEYFNVSMDYLMVGSEKDKKENPDVAFENYLSSLGYQIVCDDPEHMPFIIDIEYQTRLEADTLSQLKGRLAKYAQLMIDSELLKLREKQLKKEKEDKERLMSHMLNAANERTDIEITEEMKKSDDSFFDED